jgi:hypothetical protein
MLLLSWNQRYILYSRQYHKLADRNEIRQQLNSVRKIIVLDTGREIKGLMMLQKYRGIELKGSDRS